jgi:alpha-mannosidase
VQEAPTAEAKPMVNTPAVNLEILLFDSQKRIEFRYQVQKDCTNAKQAVYFAFPVAVSSPRQCTKC